MQGGYERRNLRKGGNEPGESRLELNRSLTPCRADMSGLIRVEKAEVVLETMVMTNVTVPVPEPVKTKAQLKAEAKEVRRLRITEL